MCPGNEPPAHASRQPRACCSTSPTAPPEAYRSVLRQPELRADGARADAPLPGLRVRCEAAESRRRGAAMVKRAIVPWMSGKKHTATSRGVFRLSAIEGASTTGHFT